MRVLDLFSGIGGFSLGLERTGGFKTVAFCEIEPFPRAVLAKHWPEVPCYDDVRTLTAGRLHADGIQVDAICGGFPCQDISLAGRGGGIDGEQSGLWAEYARLVRQLGPRWVIIENSPALRTRGGDRVLGDLEAIGYICWPFVVGAAHAGAPHRRARAWILAHAAGQQHQVCPPSQPRLGAPVLSANADSLRQLQPGWGQSKQWGRTSDGRGEVRDDALCRRYGAPAKALLSRRDSAEHTSWWSAEPGVCGVAYGVPNGTHRIAALGNAVVPQIPEAIGRAILAVEAVRQQAAA